MKCEFCCADRERTYSFYPDELEKKSKNNLFDFSRLYFLPVSGDFVNLYDIIEFEIRSSSIKDFQLIS